MHRTTKPKERIGQRALAFLLSAAMIMALSFTGPVAQTALAAPTPPTIGSIDATASTQAQLQAEINAAPKDGTQYVISLETTVTLTSTVTIPAGANIALTGGNTLTAISGNFADLTVNGSLLLGDITVTHDSGLAPGSATRGVVVNATGELDMIDGSLITDNALVSNTVSGAGVYVANNGIFNMWGGSISENSITGTTGAVAGNVIGGGGIYATGSLAAITMYGGIVANNSVESTGNASAYGGGIFTQAGASETINGGSISNNYATTRGGGICDGTANNGGVLTINGGVISGNSAGYSGGGVELGTAGVDSFINGGIIAGNSAEIGGGINARIIAPYGLIITGGSITGNAATNGSGGGIYTGNITSVPTNLNIIGGSITNNTATQNGGGIYISVGSSAESTVTAGTISGNVAGQDGGGIYTANYSRLVVGSDVSFSNNSAAQAYPVLNPADQAVYDAQVAATQWTTPYSQGYNNFDINYANGPYTVTVLNDTHGSGASSVETTAVGGTITAPAGSAMPGDTVQLSATPLPGYVFSKWITGSDISLSATDSANATFVMPSSAVVVTAQFLAAPYGVTYMGGQTSNGKTPAQLAPVDSSKYILNSAASVLDYSPLAIPGYTFTGWNTAEDGSGDEYQPGDPLTITGNMTLYAQWAPATNTVTYDGNTATSGTAPSPQQVATDATFTVAGLGALLKTGYVFTGWNTAANGSGTAYTAAQVATMGPADLTLYAQWQAANATVSFNANAADATPGSTSSESVTYDALVGALPMSAPAAPSRSGYTFLGWSTTSGANNTVNFLASNVVDWTGDMVVYAVWAPTSQQVIYDGNGATSGVPPVTSVATGVSYTIAAPGTMSRTDYTFLGWSTDPAATTPDVMPGTSATMGASSVTYYAVWQAGTETLVFDPNGGVAGSTPSMLVTYDALVGTLPATGTGAPTYPGYAFMGWSTNAGMGNTVNFTAANQVTWTGSNTVYAVWAPTLQSVSYNANGAQGTAPGTQQVATGSNFTVASASGLSEPGYTFSTWNTSPDGTGTSYNPAQIAAMGTTDITLYAIFAPAANTVIYNGNGANVGSVPAQQTVDTDAPYTVAGAGSMARTGYTFLGWATAANATAATAQPGDNDTMGDASVTYYAVWQADSEMINFNANGGTAGSVGSLAVTFDAPVGTLPTTAPAAPTWAGYTFQGWSTDPGAGNTVNFTAATMVNWTSLKTVYAVWTAANDVVTYEGNGATAGAVPAPQSQPTGSSVTVAPAGSLARSGYSFAGWNTAADGGGTSYPAGSTFAMPATGLTLYAQWSAVPSMVTYAPNGATAGSVPAMQQIATDADYTVSAPGTLARTGYTFLGWNTDASATTAAVQPGDSETMGAANVTYYAIWQIKSYSVKVSYLDPQGTLLESQESTSTYGQPYTTPAPGSMIEVGGQQYQLVGLTPGSDPTSGTVDSDKTINYTYQAVYPYTISYVADNGGTETTLYVEPAAYAVSGQDVTPDMAGLNAYLPAGFDAGVAVSGPFTVSSTGGNNFVVRYVNDAPVITSGYSNLNVQQGVTLTNDQILAIAQVSATDAQDGVIPASDITVTGSVDWNTPGTYTLTFTTQDSAGLAAEPYTITITVAPQDTPVAPTDPDPDFPETKIPTDTKVGTDPGGDPIIYQDSNVTVQTDGQGSAAATPASSGPGTTVQLSATPANGYVFAGWTVDSGTATLSDPSDPNATFTMPGSDVTVTAHFTPAPATYTVKYVDPDGTVLASEVTTSTIGAHYSTPTPDPTITVGGQLYQLTGPTSDSDPASGTLDKNEVVSYQYVAVYPYTITFVTDNGGVITTLSGATITGLQPAGSTVTPDMAALVANQPAGYGAGATSGAFVVSATGDNSFVVTYTNHAPTINVARDTLYVKQPVTLSLADILRLAGVSVTDPEEGTITGFALKTSGYSAVTWSVVNYPNGNGYLLTLSATDSAGLPAPVRQIAVFVEPSAAKVKPITPDEQAKAGLPDAPAGTQWGVDADGDYTLYVPVTTPGSAGNAAGTGAATATTALGLPKTSDAAVAVAPVALLMLIALALLALRRQRRGRGQLGD